MHPDVGMISPDLLNRETLLLRDDTHLRSAF